MPWDHDTAESYDELGRQSHEPVVRRLMRELPGPPSGNGGTPGPPAYLALLVTRIARS